MKRVCLSDSGQVLKAVYVGFTREWEKLRLVGGDRRQRGPDKMDVFVVERVHNTRLPKALGSFEDEKLLEKDDL